MTFGEVPVTGALGAVLAHSVPLKKGRLRKGKRLGDDDITALQEAGVELVVVARLAASDVSEDEAARRLAEALVSRGTGVHIGPAATGRANIFADGPGVAEIAADVIDAVNGVDPMITVATVPRWQRMETDGMIATIKIISYAVSEAAIASACAKATDGIGLRQPVHQSAALIQTVIGKDEGARGHEALEARLDALGVSMAPKAVVGHEIAPLAEALAGRTEDVLFILTASATSDIGDTAPEAVRRAGGEVSYFGMPVDPGNLLFLGHLGNRPVIGLPGCARSPALNGADWVLERVVCGVDVTGADISAMGVGGLLKEIPQRGRPRRG